MTIKSEDLSSGRGIQVVVPGPEHTFILDEEALSKLLLREDIKDRAVVVLSVAGAFRKGKSFLLDFFLRYMHHKYNLGETGDGWLGAVDEPLKGFPWRGGSERDTTGLHLWSQPFKATLDNGEKVVVLLMDTQGTFDSQSTVKDNATVFALSTMLSSVQIYNLSLNIDEDDLQHLQLFTDYGSLAQQKSSGKPFQKLQFLVRDWSYDYEYPYGAEGGQQLLSKRLEVHDGQHHELQTLRRHIAACFEELACFLMPHPGLRVATNPEFSGRLSDISEEFKTYLKQLVPMLLAPHTLVPKRIGGQRVKARELLQYFRSYMNIFNGSELPQPKTILEATAEANNLSAVAEAKEVYDSLMEEVCGGAKPYLEAARLRAEHARARNKALHAFASRKKMGGGELAKEYSDKLEKELEETFEQLLAHNEGKNIFRLAGTPIVLVALALLGYMLSLLGSGLGVQTLVAIGQTISILSLVTLGLWGYSRVSGNMRDTGLRIDEVANTMKNYAMSQAVGPASRIAAETAAGYTRKDS
ncbi:atlastin [Amyelois transitella]|uniref:atlastin n=1 Tax=Amyelois transitella TaxID=680683 RepID=UPI00067AEC80|nr:atlastin [Amyelois transitella]